MNENTEPTTAAIVPLRRGLPGVAHTVETKTRCFVLYATAAARNCAAVERLIAEELAGTGEPVPTRQSIAAWARDDAWDTQADELWRNTKQWGLRELQVIALANALLGQQRRHEVLLGLYRSDSDTAAQYLKGGELSDRFIERVLPLSAMRAPELEPQDLSGLSREQREALARQSLSAAQNGPGAMRCGGAEWLQRSPLSPPSRTPARPTGARKSELGAVSWGRHGAESRGRELTVAFPLDRLPQNFSEGSR